MFWRMLIGSLARGWRKKLLVVLASALGATLAAAMLNLSMDVSDQLNRELKSYGSNIMLTAGSRLLPLGLGDEAGALPEPRDLIDEASLPMLKTVFWRNNIVAFAPQLPLQARAGEQPVSIVGAWFDRELLIPTGETFREGLKHIRPWWKVSGRWPTDDSDEALVGRDLAARLGVRLGDTLKMSVSGRPFQTTVVGILDSGDDDDTRLFTSLAAAQRIAGVPEKLERIEVSAITTPENELARRAAADPEALTPREFEVWYCTAYVGSVAYQLEEVVPGAKARVIRQVSESEGGVLQRIQGLMWLLTLAALAASALGVSSLMTANVLERGIEIGLSKAMGADASSIVRLFLSEGAVLGIAGGLLGYGGGVALAKSIGETAFGIAVSTKPFVLPLTVALAVAVVWLASVSAVSSLVRLDPKEIIHGR